jgi:CMP-N,N'-diacetyllegionaminic acid synthase
MYKNNTFLAIIPARGGSKGLHNKNIKELCGKPLIVWSIEAGLQSEYIDEVIVSTDYRSIADIAKKHGAYVPFLRPDHLASDTTTTFDTVKHVIDFYNNELKKKFDYIVLLEPTSPLRKDCDIDNMIEKITNNEDRFDSIVSIGEVHEHPSIMKKITVDGKLISFCNNLEMESRRQDNHPAYFPYGVAYIAKTSVLLEDESFYTKKCDFYKIDRYQCYEIDDMYDFLSIENILNYKKGEK